MDMKNTGPSTVLRLLERTHRLVSLADLSRGALRAAAACLGLGLLMVYVDALYGLAPAGLVLLDVVWFGAAAAGAAGMLAAWIGNRYRPERVAVDLQRRLDLRHDQLINTLQLAARQDAQVSPGLRDYAIRIGETLAGTLDPEKAVDRAPVRKAKRAVLAMLAACLVLYLVSPRVFHAVLPRLFQPFGDHPPYTLLRFEVEVTPGEIFAGRPADIVVEIRGPRVPLEADAVFREEGVEPERIALWRVQEEEDEMKAADREPVRAGFGLFGPGESYRFRLHVDRAERSRRFYIDTPKGRSKMFALDVLKVPLFESMLVEYRYPAYTGWAPRTERLGEDGMRALAGTETRLSVGSNVDLREGQIDLAYARGAGDGDPSSVTMSPRPHRPRTVEAAWTLAGAGDMTVSLTGVDGTAGREARTVSFAAVADEPPEAFIEYPPRTSLAPETWKAEVELSAEDDVRVEAVSFLARVNDGPYEEVPIAPDSERKNLARWGHIHTLDLAALGAKGGDKVDYFSRVRDNAPGGGQLAESVVGTIEVMTEEAFENLMRNQYGMEEILQEVADFRQALEDLREQREALLEELKALNEELRAPGTVPTPEQLQRLTALRQALRQYARSARELEDQLRRRMDKADLYEFEQPYKEWLGKTADQLGDQARDADGIMREWDRGQGGFPGNVRMTGAIGRFKDNQDPFGPDPRELAEKVAVDLEKLEAASRMMHQANRLKELIEQQRDLEQRMAAARLVESTDEATAERLRNHATEQDSLRRDLADICEELETGADAAREALPKMCESADRIVDSIKKMQVEEDQSEAVREAWAGRAPEAWAEADEAATKLESLVGECNGTGQCAATDLDGCLSLTKAALRKALAQLSLSLGMGNAGSAGAGYGGFMATYGLLGPPYPMPGDTWMTTPMRGRNGKAGKAGADRPEIGEGPETVLPENVAADERDVVALPGVPLRYRPVAEAYFKRLAEEER